MEPPKFVRLNPAFDPGAAPYQPTDPNELRVAFGDGEYEVFYTPAEPNRYRVLRLDVNAPRVRSCRAEIALSYGRGPRIQLANLFVDVSAIGGFNVRGLDEQLLDCVAQVYAKHGLKVNYDSLEPYASGRVKVVDPQCNPLTLHSPALNFPRCMSLTSKLDLLFHEKRYLGEVPR